MARIAPTDQTPAPKPPEGYTSILDWIIDATEGHEHEDTYAARAEYVDLRTRCETAERERAAMLQPGGFKYMDDERRRLQTEADRYRHAAEALVEERNRMQLERDEARAEAERLKGATT